MTQRTGSRWLERWEPEDEQFWKGEGRAIAWRNLVWSIVAENIGFSVWLLWSVVAMKLPKVGFHYTTEQLFQLVALPGLVGCLMRFPYTFAVPRFGGRNWTIVSALLLLIPTVSLAVLVGRTETPFWLMATAAATAGLGGGNFASSMANISFFFPDRDKGFALGLNAAGGNIGVSTVQLLVPLVVGAGARLAFAGWMWLPLIGLAALGAYAQMNNLTSARSSFGDQIAMARRKHTWVISWLYIGTFGSFVGYAAAFPLLLKTQFPEASTGLAFLGPLVGSIARPLGGKLADRLGGAPVTFGNFLVMTLATLGVVHSLGVHSFPEFLATFLALFVTTGIGNGSTFRMIPAIFRAEALAAGAGGDSVTALARGRRDTAAVLGLCSAIGAVGGYLIPQAFSTSIRAGSGATGALAVFIAFYATCLAMTWWHYLRANGFASRARSFAAVKV
jgi:NNP family nitrate/nitrite transporter-like MFS transporter